MHLVNPLVLHVNFLCSGFDVECKVLIYYKQDLLSATQRENTNQCEVPLVKERLECLS